MKKIVDLSKSSSEVFILDNDNYELNISDNIVLQKYEKAYNVRLDEMLIEFISKVDNESVSEKGFNKIILDIKDMVETNNIDCFVVGYPVGEDDETVCITFNINNRLSTMDCELRVFYHNYKNRSDISIEVLFSKGAGSSYGYNFFKYFNYNDYAYNIRPILKKYFESKEDKEVEKKLIEYFTSNITNQVENYYGE
jgi:RNase H-fold protein (predicted Holliday junction resolvase)